MNRRLCCVLELLAVFGLKNMLKRLNEGVCGLVL